MPITIREVAKEAGVSIAAVSKVLHGRGSNVRVSQERADHIRRIATSLNYRPNALARNLRSSRTHTVGLIFENFWNISDGPLYYLHLLDGVASPLFNNHYRLTILPEMPQRDILGTLGDGQLEGVIWCKFLEHESIRNILNECPIPVVAMSTPAPHEESRVVYVSCENAAGIELAVEHLWNLGHRNIAFLHEVQESDTPDLVARRDGFLQSMARRGMVHPQVLSWEWHFEPFHDWRNSKDRATAVICWSERSAGKLLEQAQQANLDVPNELSVIGFDSTQYCETTTPRLSAVRQPIFEMARHASETLLSMIRGDHRSPRSFSFPCSLELRNSTAPPSSMSRIYPS
jgi:LacI family transcriptional regulator